MRHLVKSLVLNLHFNFSPANQDKLKAKCNGESDYFEGINASKENKNSTWETMNVMKRQANEEEGFPRATQAISKEAQEKSRKEWQLWNKKEVQRIKNG